MWRKKPMRASGMRARTSAGTPHQVVVLDPDEVTRTVMLHHRVGEAAVHSLVVVESLDLQRQLAGEVMEERPEHPVGVRLVVAMHLLLGEGHLDQPHRPELRGERRGVLLRKRLHQPCPADPQPAGSLVRTEQAGGDAADARLDLDFARLRADRHRKPVGHDEDA
jgi:hypothetical protein